MPDPTHDPPESQVNATPAPTAAAMAEIFTGRGFERYQLMRERLGYEPMILIYQMRTGGYRSRIHADGATVLDQDGLPVPDRMSFRDIAPELLALTGIEVTYETVRRWWDLYYPGDTSPARRRRQSRRRTPAVAAVDDAALEAAMAAAGGTNPAVPRAAFLPPTGE